MKINKIKNVKRIISVIIITVFSVSTIHPPQALAQTWTVGTGLSLPLPGSMVSASLEFSPVLMKGMQIFPEDPLRFDFIVDSGDSGLEEDNLKDATSKVIKYFLAGLTVPEEDLWVNLSPYEEDRVIPVEFGNTGMGRDLLAQDYILKQLSASLIYPENELGQNFWNSVYAKAYEQYGTTNIPINTFNKVWIVPEKAVVYENEDTAFIIESHLKVMLEEDYLSIENNLDNEELGMDRLKVDKIEELSSVSSEVVREIVLPAIEKEVNEGKNFAVLRQIYHSLILATWFKNNLKESLLGQAYVDQKKTAGINIKDPEIKEKIYQQYLKAFEKGAYNYIRKDYDPYTQQTINRKYISGGAVFEDLTKIIQGVKRVKKEVQQKIQASSSLSRAETNLNLVQASSPIDGKKNAGKIISPTIEAKEILSGEFQNKDIRALNKILKTIDNRISPMLEEKNYREVLTSIKKLPKITKGTIQKATNESLKPHLLRWRRSFLEQLQNESKTEVTLQQVVENSELLGLEAKHTSLLGIYDSLKTQGINITLARISERYKMPNFRKPLWNDRLETQNQQEINYIFTEELMPLLDGFIKIQIKPKKIADADETALLELFELGDILKIIQNPKILTRDNLIGEIINISGSDRRKVIKLLQKFEIDDGIFYDMREQSPKEIPVVIQNYSILFTNNSYLNQSKLKESQKRISKKLNELILTPENPTYYQSIPSIKRITFGNQRLFAKLYPENKTVVILAFDSKGNFSSSEKSGVLKASFREYLKKISETKRVDDLTIKLTPYTQSSSPINLELMLQKSPELGLQMGTALLIKEMRNNLRDDEQIKKQFGRYIQILRDETTFSDAEYELNLFRPAKDVLAFFKSYNINGGDFKNQRLFIVSQALGAMDSTQTSSSSPLISEAKKPIKSEIQRLLNVRRNQSQQRELVKLLIDFYDLQESSLAVVESGKEALELNTKSNKNSLEAIIYNGNIAQILLDTIISEAKNILTQNGRIIFNTYREDVDDITLALKNLNFNEFSILEGSNGTALVSAKKSVSSSPIKNNFIMTQKNVSLEEFKKANIQPESLITIHYKNGMKREGIYSKHTNQTLEISDFNYLLWKPILLDRIESIDIYQNEFPDQDPTAPSIEYINDSNSQKISVNNITGNKISSGSWNNTYEYPGEIDGIPAVVRLAKVKGESRIDDVGKFGLLESYGLGPKVFSWGKTLDGYSFIILEKIPNDVSISNAVKVFKLLLKNRILIADFKPSDIKEKNGIAYILDPGAIKIMDENNTDQLIDTYRNNIQQKFFYKGVEEKIQSFGQALLRTLNQFESYENSFVNNIPDRKSSLAASPLKKGGIDLTADRMDVQTRGEGSGFNVPVDIQAIEEMNFDGLVPEILLITPIPAVQVPLLLGVTNEEDGFPAQEANTSAHPQISSLVFREKFKVSL